MAVTAKARAKLSFYITMLVGSLCIAIFIGTMTACSGIKKVFTAFSVVFLGLLIVGDSLNRQPGRYDLQS